MTTDIELDIGQMKKKTLGSFTTLIKNIFEMKSPSPCICGVDLGRGGVNENVN